MNTRVLTLYGRSHCHLCEEMQAALGPWRTRLDFSLTVVDIDRDAALARKFNEKVPVLAEGEHEICCHYLDEEALLRHFGTSTNDEA